jgi:Protein kinase domain
MSNTALAPEGSGLMLGRYRPLRPLGSGGSGSVWLARDEQTGLDIALKIVPREGKAAARAEREAQAAAKLRHPSCLRAYAFARDPRHVYIAYEFVPGRTFREVLRAGELDDRSAIEACAQICDGLAHAHGAGILHRDVKPSNVLLADGDRVSVRILDFGLARMVEAETLTAQGDVPGTLAYIAPERLAGDDATGAADVWAVGVMLWEALSGRHPFWQTSMLDTARAIESGAPPLATLRPDLPKALLQLVDRSLSLAPARRPSAHELAAHLRGAAAPRRTKRTRSSGFAVAVPTQAGRVAAAALAAGFASSTAAALPFFPHGWPVALAVLAAAATGLRERLGLAVALAVPILPLGNASLGLAIAYAALAAAWLALSWREPRSALLFVLGPLLAPSSALGLLPLAASGVRSPVRRAAQVAAGILVAAVATGLRHGALPFAGGPSPLGIGVAGAGDPFDVVGSVARAAGAHPALLVEAAVLAVVAAALPYARARGRWGAAAVGAAMVVLTVPAVPTAAIAPLVVAAWLTAGVLAARAGTE